MLVQHAARGDQVLEDLRELERLPRGRRIWLLFSHPETRRGLDEEELYLSYLDLNGRQLDARLSKDSSIYLYELARR
jgi:hypothetical protein